jgi:uncharacterized membrane protein
MNLTIEETVNGKVVKRVVKSEAARKGFRIISLLMLNAMLTFVFFSVALILTIAAAAGSASWVAAGVMLTVSAVSYILRKNTKRINLHIMNTIRLETKG